jgi:hypothetical protein
MRGCHDPAGVRAVGRRETRIEVLLSERYPELHRHNRTRALPFRGLVTPIAIPSKDRLTLGRSDLASTAPWDTGRAKNKSSQPDDLCVDPLYLFVCALSWRRHSTTSAGWELIGYVRSSGQAAKIAADLLAQGESLPVQSRVCAMGDPGKASRQSDAGLPASARRQL